MPIKILQLCLVFVSTFKKFVEFSLSGAAQLLKLRLQTWASARGAGGIMPPGFSHTLSQTSQITKILQFLVINTGSIFFAPPPLKNFLPTPMITNKTLVKTNISTVTFCSD